MATNRKTWQCWLLTIILIVIKWEGANICVRTGWQKLEASWQKFRVCRQKVEGVGVRIVANLLTGLKKNLGGGGAELQCIKMCILNILGAKNMCCFSNYISVHFKLLLTVHSKHILYWGISKREWYTYVQEVMHEEYWTELSCHTKLQYR